MSMLLTQANSAASLPEPGIRTWIFFGLFVVVLLVFDLLILNRKHEEPSLRKSTAQTLLFVALAAMVGVALFIFTDFGGAGVGQFAGAYVTEWSLSVDNIFVIALIMTFFGVPREYQHKVLFWGILGALVMRLAFITVGLAAIERFALITAFLGAFLIYSGINVARGDDKEPDVTQMRSYRLFTRFIPTTKRFYGDRFITRLEGGGLKATPLLVCVMVVEAVDGVFATDSIPAVLAISDNHFIAFSSNVMAIMGLRSVFFLFAHIQDRVTRLNEGLGIILGFVGIKMVIANETVMGLLHLPVIHFPLWISLGVIFLALIGSVFASLIWPKQGEVSIEEVAQTDTVMVQVYLDASDTMAHAWSSSLVNRYTAECVQLAGRYDTDELVPVLAFANQVEPLGTVPVDDPDTVARPQLGASCNLAGMLRHAQETARRTTGRFIFVILTSGRVDNERAAREVFVTMPNNAFILFVRVSDMPGGARFLQGLDDDNIGSADRCDTIHATDNLGIPLENIGDVIDREIVGWLLGDIR